MNTFLRARRTTRLLPVVMLTLGLAACGGGDSSNDDVEEPPPEPPPDSGATAIERLDALPQEGVTQYDPALPEITLSHFGYSDFSIAVSGDCAGGTTFERTLVDVSEDFDALYEHKQLCDGLADTGAYETMVEATRGSEDSFEVSLAFSTTTGMAPALQVQDSVTLPSESVADLFQTFIDESLVDQLDLPDAVAALIEASVEAIADAAYDDLVNAEALFGVTTQRVTYASRQPDGNASGELTGLVAFPDTSSGDFTARDSVIVLSHSTGVTPSDLDATDGWYVVASLLASRGYLVIAPDNWGRGGTSGDPETFLMGTRTAANSLDMIRAVLADPDYDTVYPADAPQITIVGYSQGGHTAVALWHTLAAQAPTLAVPQVYAGAGPYNLYALARGVVQHADGTCDDDPYCRFVTDETTVPFLTERVLPGYLAYADDSLTLDELVEDGLLTESFVDDFLDDDPALDRLKGQLQQSSFTNFTDGLDELVDAGTTFTLFHSEYDRLVPVVNSEELSAVLEPHFTVDFRTDSCDSEAYQAIFEATDQAGISHALCGFEMLNDVFAELR